jgi:hypothetical protein
MEILRHNSSFKFEADENILPQQSFIVANGSIFPQQPHHARDTKSTTEIPERCLIV